MTERESAAYGLEALGRRGADRAQCAASRSEKWELGADSGEISLLRTTFNINVGFKAIQDGRQGASASNKTDAGSLDALADAVMEIAGASQPDSAYDIAGAQQPERFSAGEAEPDLDLMADRMAEFISTANKRFPHTILEQLILDFSRTRSALLNTNGVEFNTERGLYSFSAMFTSKDGEKTSSFNHSGFSAERLDRPLMEYGSVATLLRQSSEQLDVGSIRGKYTGEVIITPDCLGSFLWSFAGAFLSDGPLISGTSIHKDSLGEKVADERLSLHSRPVSEEIAGGYFVTGDGFKAENSTIIDQGVLRTFLLSLYGARKTGRERAVNSGGAFVVDPGDTSFDDLVRSVKRGILLCRFSGGHPSDNGDFSGVAKNSYAIEDGSVAYPVSETMVSGNVAEIFRNIGGVSRDRVHFGGAILPWVLTSGLTISGK